MKKEVFVGSFTAELFVTVKTETNLDANHCGTGHFLIQQIGTEGAPSVPGTVLGERLYR